MCLWGGCEPSVLLLCYLDLFPNFYTFKINKIDISKIKDKKLEETKYLTFL